MPNRSSRDDAPEFLDRRLDHGVVLRRGAARVVVQHVQAAEGVQRGADRGLDAGLVRDVGPDRDRAVAGQVRRLLAGRDGDVRHDHLGALAREQHRGGAADPGGRTRDERHLACQSCHGISYP